jgi:hypothetical protein
VAALEAAAAMEAAGDHLGAIDALVDANRRGASAEIERQLLHLRYRAFKGIPHATRTASPPEPDPGPLREVEGLPAVHARDLSAATVRAGILSGGCLLVERLVSRARVHELTAAIDRAFDGYDASAAGDSHAASAYEPFAPEPKALHILRPWLRTAGGVMAADSPRMMFELTETLGDTGLLAVITEYLGERPAISMDKCTLRRVSGGEGIEWHQDGAFLGDVPALNVWICLSNCGRDSPGLDLYPRRLSDLLETGTGDATYDWSIGPGVVAQLPGALCRPRLRAGDVLLFDQFLVHRTSNEPGMTGTRYAIETWFFAPSRYPGQQEIPLLL